MGQAVTHAGRVEVRPRLQNLNSDGYGQVAAWVGARREAVQGRRGKPTGRKADRLY